MADTEFVDVQTGPAEPRTDMLQARSQLPRQNTTGPDEAANLAGLLKEDVRKKIQKQVCDDFDADSRSRAGRMKKLREFTELYAGLLKPKRFPWHNCANVNLNILSYSSLQVHARLMDMILPDNGKIIHAAPATVDDFARATITDKFSNSYIRNKMPEFEPGMDDTLAQIVVYGSGFRRTYWDVYEARLRSDWIPIEDFVVAQEHRSQDPSMRDVPRYTMVLHETLADLEMKAAEGVYENVDGIKAGDDERPDSDVADVRSQIDGVTAPDDATDADKHRMVLEQHRKLKLPKSGAHPAFDGNWHYVIATVDKQSGKLLRLTLREEDDPEDVKRYEREASQPGGFNEFKAKAELYARADPATAIAPVPVDEPRKPRKRQITFFTHYKAFYSEGFYGLGFGDFIGPMNRAANTLLNQHIDGVSQRNARPGFISRQMRMQRGAINTAPGTLIEVDAPASTIKDGIVFLDPPMNDPTTLGLVNLLVQMADKFAGSSDVMSGSTSGANRTAKEMQILNAQLMKQISVLAKRVRIAFKHEIDKMWRCWATFLPREPEPTDVVDVVSGQPERLEISGDMFIPDARVMPACDARMRFERVEEAQNRMGFIMNNPMTAQNPAIVRAATEDMLKATDAERMIPLLGPPPGPPQPPQPKPPLEEQASWLEEQDSPVTPEDNDDEHVQSHMMFMNSPMGAAMSQPGRQMAERHVRSHLAAKMRKEAQAMQPPMPPGPGPMPMQPPGPMP